MEFTNEFTVPVDVERAFEILTDLARVAPCLPGANLEEVDGQAHTGTIKVKVGPINVTYRGTAEVTRRDAAARHAVLEAVGKEARGAGTARANVRADLADAGADTTKVTVVTDLVITGKPAQFGRDVMADVGAKLVATFADNLAVTIAADELLAPERQPADLPPPTAQPEAAALAPEQAGHEAAEGAPALAGTLHPPPPSPSEPRRVPPPARELVPSDHAAAAGGPGPGRAGPLVAVAAVAGLVWWWRRHR